MCSTCRIRLKMAGVEGEGEEDDQEQMDWVSGMGSD
jgi:ferredoxin